MRTGCVALRVGVGWWVGWKYVALDAVDIFGGCVL